MTKQDTRMRLIVKDKSLQSKIQKVMADQEITHEQLLEKYLKLPLEGDLTGLHDKYELFTKFTKKHVIKSRDINKIDLLMGHIWVMIANVIRGLYDPNKISETLLINMDDKNWVKEINAEDGWNEMNNRYKEEPK
jgi:hypothetical protein